MSPRRHCREKITILKTERVCGRHFHSGQPVKHFDQFNRDWVPSLNLGKNDYQRPKDHKASSKGWKETEGPIEKQEQEAAKNRELLEHYWNFNACYESNVKFKLYAKTLKMISKMQILRIVFP